MPARLGALSLFLLLAMVGLALTASAAETTTTAAPDETTTTVAIEPAVPVTEAPETPTQADWTYRYFIPTLLVLAALVVVVTVVQYFLMVVRKRYRVLR
ncbi:MAG TPA: hypothetical protein VJR05_10105 [Acidimicrobiia bacterium]|nr:hypothetical protein [Acidimicrobiia bacterium]